MLSTRWARLGGTPYKEPQTPPEAFLEESSTYFCPLGKCCLNNGITNQKFPMFCKCHFSSSPPFPPPSSGRGNTFSHQKHSQQQRRGEPGWPLAPTGGVLPAHRLHSRGHGAKEGVGTAGKAQGDSCERALRRWSCAQVAQQLELLEVLE